MTKLSIIRSAIVITYQSRSVFVTARANALTVHNTSGLHEVHGSDRQFTHCFEVVFRTLMIVLTGVETVDN